MYMKTNRKEIQKKYREKNKEKIKIQIKEYKEKNKDLIKEKSKKYKEKNKDLIKEKSKEYYLKNKEKISEKNKSYKSNMSDEKRNEINKKRREKYNNEKNKKYYDENKDIIFQKRKLYRKKRYSEDILYKLKEGLRRTISMCLIKQGYTKQSRTHNILGCSYDDFKLYLENQFEDWMSWNNYGLYDGTEKYGWDIDHIIPLSSGKTEEEILKLNHYTNLRPLCSFINRVIKKDKY